MTMATRETRVQMTGGRWFVETNEWSGKWMLVSVGDRLPTYTGIATEWANTQFGKMRDWAPVYGTRFNHLDTRFDVSFVISERCSSFVRM